MARKKIYCAFGVGIDSVTDLLGSYEGEDSPSDIQRGVFAAEADVPRLLRLFKKYDLRASFFVPGHSIETFPDQCRQVVDEGHEIGAPGYSHENPVAMTPAQEEAAMAKSPEVIEKLSGKLPRGYVAPWWEMSSSTTALLKKYGFVYDHSQGYRDSSGRCDRRKRRQSRCVHGQKPCASGPENVSQKVRWAGCQG